MALVGSWQTPDQRPVVLARLKKELEAGFVADLSRDFRVLPLVTYDATRGLPHPQDTWGNGPDVGVLVLEYTERKGRKFDPSGNATDITAVLRLYVPRTRTAVWAREIDATTPQKVRGTDLGALHTEAIADLAGQLRSLDDEIATNRRSTP